MRCLVVFLIISMSSYLVSQNNTGPEQIIEDLLNTGLYTHIVPRTVSTKGDAACVALTKVIGGRKLTDSQIDAAISVVYQSFVIPESIENPADREPRTALFVLSDLSRYATKAETKKRIADTAVFVKGQFAKSGGTPK